MTNREGGIKFLECKNQNGGGGMGGRVLLHIKSFGMSNCVSDILVMIFELLRFPVVPNCFRNHHAKSANF